MPELPEVETVKRGLQKSILGKRIKTVEVRVPKIISIGARTVSNFRRVGNKTARGFETLLIRQKITAVERRAKMLLIHLSGSHTLLVHLKMTGQFIYAPAGSNKQIKTFNASTSQKIELPHQHTHVIFYFSDSSRLFYNDMRKFGYLRLVPDEDMTQVKELREFGPEPFGKDFTPGYLIEKAKSRPLLSVKQFLMDQGIIAGIGNIYSDEILYWSKLLPQKKVRTVSPDDMSRICHYTRQVLKDAIRAQGSSVGDFFTVDGREGVYGKEHMVYGRYGEKCLVCGEIIQKVKLGGRTGSYCGNCQEA